jgi:DNA polymerase elongation subunit (family B)
MSEPKILVFDIETSPHLGWFWGLWKQNIRPDQIKDASRMICFAAKWVGSNSITFRSEYHHSREEMLLTLRNLLDEADVIVTYNGDKFDMKRAKREFRLAGIEQPSSSISVDLYKVIKKSEDWPSHSMGYIAESLGLSQKMKHHGFLLWREAMGDFGEERQRKAWNIMRRYNKQDLKPTEDLFHRYEAEIALPAAGLWAPSAAEDREVPSCPNPLCQSDHVTRQGYRRTKTRRYPQYHCETCGKWFSETRSESGVTAS